MDGEGRGWTFKESASLVSLLNLINIGSSRNWIGKVRFTLGLTPEDPRAICKFDFVARPPAERRPRYVRVPTRTTQTRSVQLTAATEQHLRWGGAAVVRSTLVNHHLLRSP